MQSFGEARCKVNGQWYPYSHPNCKSNTISTSNFVMFMIKGGKFTPCIPVSEVDDLEEARRFASSFSGLSDCRAFSDGDFIDFII